MQLINGGAKIAPRSFQREAWEERRRERGLTVWVVHEGRSMPGPHKQLSSLPRVGPRLAGVARVRVLSLLDLRGFCDGDVSGPELYPLQTRPFESEPLYLQAPPCEAAGLSGRRIVGSSSREVVGSVMALNRGP